MFKDIAGVVVLYHPDESVLRNISSYSSSIGKLFVVDNSETTAVPVVEALHSTFRNIEYIHLRQNQGIARALNVAASKAAEEGFDWLLTMDQDSQASGEMIGNLLKALDKVPKDQVGILAPRYVLEAETSKIFPRGLQEVYVAITSGSLLNLRAFLKIGPFREDFFIDYVDHEYCLRLQLNKYKVLVDNDVLLYHKLGNSRNHSVLGYQINASHHNFIRRYYITRNRLAVLKAYKRHFPYYYKGERTNNIRELLKVIFFEDNKAKKIKSIMLGYLDFKKNKFGKYTY